MRNHIFQVANADIPYMFGTDIELAHEFRYPGRVRGVRDPQQQAGLQALQVLSPNQQYFMYYLNGCKIHLIFYSICEKKSCYLYQISSEYYADVTS